MLKLLNKYDKSFLEDPGLLQNEMTPPPINSARIDVKRLIFFGTQFFVKGPRTAGTRVTIKSFGFGFWLSFKINF